MTRRRFLARPSVTPFDETYLRPKLDKSQYLRRSHSYRCTPFDETGPEHIFQIGKIVESVEFTTYQGKHFSALIVFVVSSVKPYLYLKNRDHCLVIKNKFSIKRESVSHAAEVAQSVRTLDSHTEDKVLKSRTKQV